MKLALMISSVLFLSLSNAQATEPGATLSAGKPAGVRQAQLLDGGNGMFLVAGAALVGITIALATASNDSSQPTATTPVTSTTGTNP